MPRHPQEPHLFAVKVDNRDVAVVRAMSLAEARDYYLEQHVGVVKLSPSEAFRIGHRCEVIIENAKPEYADPEDEIQTDFWSGRVWAGIDHPPTSGENDANRGIISLLPNDRDTPTGAVVDAEFDLAPTAPEVLHD